MSPAKNRKCHLKGTFALSGKPLAIETHYCVNVANFFEKAVMDICADVYKMQYVQDVYTTLRISQPT